MGGYASKIIHECRIYQVQILNPDKDLYYSNSNPELLSQNYLLIDNIRIAFLCYRVNYPKVPILELITRPLTARISAIK